MQETLNEMVSKVRRGVMTPDDASRTIHGSAAMLGLQLAENLPETALIVTGMRKQVTKEHIVKAFKEFGEIESAAVSSKERGFGTCRICIEFVVLFSHLISGTITDAISQFRTCSIPFPKVCPNCNGQVPQR